MQCEKVQRQISAYMDGELDQATVRSVERHISQCGECRKVAADFQAVDALVRRLPDFDMSDDFVGKLLERVDEAHAGDANKPLDRSFFRRFLFFMLSFMDLLEARELSSNRTLDEFGDFPPSSMGSIYFKLLDHPGRG